VRAIRTRYPECHLTVLTERVFRPLLSDNPKIDRILELRDGTSLTHLAREIRHTRYTHKLDLQGDGRTRLLRTLAPGNWSSYSKRPLARGILIRFKRDRYGGTSPPVAERYFEAARALEVTPDGKPAEFPLSDDADRHADGWLLANGLDGSRPLVALAPRMASETKCWPVSHWITLVRELAADGINSVVVGDPEDVAACAQIAASGGDRAKSVAGTFGLQRSGALIARARALVTGENGHMHMATAVGTPVVALFGPTVRQFGFQPYSAPSVVLERDLACRPCSVEGGPSCPLGHHRCLRDIQPTTVRRALDQWL
jgi:heptosyltransferase-2